MSKPLPVMVLGYAPPGTMPLNLGTQTIRRGLIYKGSSRLSAAHSLAVTRTSLSFTSGGFSSMIPLQIRFKAASTIRISQEPSNSLATGYTDTGSNSWTEWENCFDCYQYGRKMFARAISQGAPLQYEVQATRRVAVGSQ